MSNNCFLDYANQFLIKKIEFLCKNGQIEFYKLLVILSLIYCIENFILILTKNC